MEALWMEIADNLVYVIIGLCFIVGIIMKGITTIVTQSAREKSRREIAAYIAEGSMSAEQGEQLLRAEDRRCGRPA